MSINNISNEGITRTYIENMHDISEEDKSKMVSIFDQADAKEDDLNVGILTTADGIRNFLKQAAEKIFNGNYSELLKKLSPQHSENEDVVAETTNDLRSGFTENEEWYDIGLRMFIPSASFEHFDKFQQIINKIDNGDGKLQENEAVLVRILLKMANNLVKDSQDITDKNQISLKGLELLLEHIDNGSIDIEKLKEAIKNKNTLQYEYPDAEDITQNLKIKSPSNYDIKVFRTNSTTSYTGDSSGNELLEYNTFVISFTNPKTGTSQNINIHFDKLLNERIIVNTLEDILAKSSSNIVDALCNEVDDLYITSSKHSKKHQYRNTSQVAVAGGQEDPGTCSINLYYNGGIDFHTLVHELGHTRDNEFESTGILYKRIQESKKDISKYFLDNQLELFAEFFSDYASIREGIEKDINKHYKDIISQLPDEAKQKLYSEVTVSILTNQDMTVSAVLDRAGLSEYKELFQRKLNKSFRMVVIQGNSHSHISYMEKLCKKHPEVKELYENFVRQVAETYENPNEGVVKYYSHI